LAAYDTVIIGGGQAGLTMSHQLTKRGHAHVVLERHRIADRWRTERWDSLRFQFPNWAMRLPDFPYTGNEPDAYAPRDEVIRFIESYATFIDAPVRTGVNVHSLRQAAEGFLLDTGDATITARNVVIATGPYQRPAIPPAAANLPGMFQITAASYRNPGQLPAGGVLVVGSGASGVQIAEELQQAGRAVFLSAGPHRRVPRRYRGRDYIWWISELGLDEKVADQGATRQAPLVLTGADGGHTIDLRAFAASGMTLLGRLLDAKDGTVSFAPDLEANLAAGDAAYDAFIQTADTYAAEFGLTLPDDPAAHAILREPPAAPIESLDLDAAGITAVIWATGYRYDFGWVKLEIFTATGQPIHSRGVTNIPGVYFLGLPFLHKTKSSFLSGVGEDAAYLADQIAIKSKTSGRV
jgi:putative flavoprotein involved in K+ transport